MLGFGFTAHAFNAKVVKVSDGDTLLVRNAKGDEVKIRLYGIDCPESSQAYGSQAKRFTAGLVLHKTVMVQKIETDQYGRMVAVIMLRGEDTSLNENLVKSGYAWYYPNYCKRFAFCQTLKKYESEAKKQKLGLWRDDNPTPPWDFRKAPVKKDLDYWIKEVKELLRMAKSLLREIINLYKTLTAG